MGGFSVNTAGMPSFLRPRPDDSDAGNTAPANGGDGTLGGMLARVQQMRGIVAEGAAAMQARQALGIRPSVPASGAPTMAQGGGASIEDALCGCACCDPTTLATPRSFAEPATAEIYQAPASFDAPVIADEAPAPTEDAPATVEDAPAPDEATAAPADEAPATPPAPAASEGGELPADAAPHDTTRREGEPNPVYYGDAPVDIPLPPAPGATGTDARADADPGAQVPPGEIDANAAVEAPEPAPVDAAPVEDAPPVEPAPAPLRPLGELTPNQFTDGPSLTAAEGQAACGPAAAVAFARFVGKDLSLDHVAGVAREVGWDTSGMKGPGTQVQLLDKLGIKSSHEEPVNWDKVRETVQSGTPVIIDTPGHYWVAEGYNPEDGRFNFAKSGAVYGDGGKTWYTPEEMTPHSGAPRSAIFLEQ